MIRESLSQLISEALVREVSARVLQKLQARQKKALVLFTGAMIGFEQALDDLARLREEGYVFSALLSESAAAVLETRRIREALGLDTLTSATAESSLLALRDPSPAILVPSLTVRSAAQLAHLMADTPVTRIIQDALLRGKKVIVCTDGCCPDCWAKLGYPATQPLKARMGANLHRLEDYGLILTRAQDLYHTTMRQLNLKAALDKATTDSPVERWCPGKVISAGNIVSCPHHSILRVPQGSIITQLARETAAARDVAILKEK